MSMICSSITEFYYFFRLAINLLNLKNMHTHYIIYWDIEMQLSVVFAMDMPNWDTHVHLTIVQWACQ